MSLLDISIHNKQKLRISSPLSLEALNRQGMRESELWYKDDEELVEHYKL